MLNISAEHKKEHLYLEVYHYYRKLILEGRLLPGSKMPSLRKCAQELKLSRTTIENAYLLLAADGYIIARAQSGYYVTGIASKQHLLTPEKQDKDITPCLYDFASSGIFEKCGIPYFVDEKHSVLMNPFVEFLRAAIEPRWPETPWRRFDTNRNAHCMTCNVFWEYSGVHRTPIITI